MIDKSESIVELTKALVSSQLEIENASKNSVNPHYKSKYADLAEILKEVRPVFAKHGIAVTQWLSCENGVASVTTVISHGSGEFMACKASAPLQKQDAQGVGSATTYLRRYSLAAIAGITQEDDDAEGTKVTVKSPAQQPRVTKPAATPVKKINLEDASPEVWARAVQARISGNFAKVQDAYNVSAETLMIIDKEIKETANV